MFKRLKEFLKKKRKESQNNQAAYWDDEIDEELDYDWDEESSEDEDDVYGDYGRYGSCEDRYTCRWEDGCGGCP